MRPNLPPAGHRHQAVFHALGLAVLLLFSPSPAKTADEEAPPGEFQKNAAKFVQKCAKCHTVGQGDRVGPDLKNVVSRRERDWLLGFIQKPGDYLDGDPEAIKLLEKFNGVRMDDLGLSRAEAEGLLDYIEAASAGPIGPEEPETLKPQDPYAKLPMPDEGKSASVAGVVFLIILLAGSGALWQFSLRRTAGVLVLAAAVIAYWSFGGRRYHLLLGNQQGYSPRQPVAFSHKRHAGDMRIHCLYCHHGAEKSDVAGVPSLNICMNCHTAVKNAEDAPSAEIAKLASVWDSRASDSPKTLEWNRVHRLPDYVHFSHQAHVGNDIKCQECHGPVQEMERMRQASSLSMGWCVNCHRRGPGEAPTHWKRSGAALDCAACHW